MIKQNANSIIEIMGSYEEIVKQQLYMMERHESSEKINHLNEKLLQLKTYFLKLVTNIDNLVRQEQKLLAKPSAKSFLEKSSQK